MNKAVTIDLIESPSADDLANILHIDTESVKCFLCNNNFKSGDKSFLIFNERVQNDGSFDCPLSQILSAALDAEVDEATAHSTLLCMKCNSIVLNFEKLERKLFEVRTSIINAYDNTRKHLEMLYAFSFVEVSHEDRKREILMLSPETAGVAPIEFLADGSYIKKEATNPEEENEISEEDVIIYENLMDCQNLNAEEVTESENKDEDKKFFSDLQMAAEDSIENENLNEIWLESQQISSDADVFTEFNTPTEDSNVGEIIKCDLCENTFENEHALGKHFAEQHVERMGDFHYECESCNLAFDSYPALLKHISSHDPENSFICEFCMKCFASKYSLQVHKKTHGERVRPFECNQCEKKFLTQHNLQQHRKIHTKDRPFVCTVCQKSFATQHNLDAHGITHSGIRPYNCQTCGKSFARKAELVDHERIHTGLRPFKCDFCELSFTQRSNLTAHKKTTHLNEKMHKCDLCDRSFKRRRLLEYHKNAVHTGERPYKCDKCSSSFVYKEHYKKHLIIHSGLKPFACEVCNKSFNSRDNRNAHRFVHSDKKPYECVECGAGFMRKPLLLAHMKHFRHLNDTIIVNQPQINGGVLQTATVIVKSTEEAEDEPQEMITDHLDEDSQSNDVKNQETSSTSKINNKAEKSDDVENYKFIVTMDDFVASPFR